MKKINKKYYEIMRQADNAVGRKEVVSLLKKAAIIMSKSEENFEDAAIMINGSIMPEFNHLKSLIFLLITLGIFSDSLNCNLTSK